jgi:hypothetical protein
VDAVGTIAAVPAPADPVADPVDPDPVDPDPVESPVDPGLAADADAPCAGDED